MAPKKGQLSEVNIEKKDGESMEKINRNKGLGGTDIGCVIGVNPWRTAMDVYLDKLGITEPQADNEAMYWGREMEPVLAKRYQKETGIELYIPDSSDLPIHHWENSWYLGSPDALIGSSPVENKDGSRTYTVTGGVDFKTTGRREGWGAPGSDEVPEWIHTQADWYMGLTGAEWWDIAVLFFSPRREFSIYRIPRNQELIDNLIEAGREFWENHVIPRIPPPIDASEGSKKLLNHLYPRDTEDLFAADEKAELEAEWIQTFETQRDDAIKALTYHQNKLKEIIGNHVGVVTSLGKVLWKRSRDREIINWQGIAEELSASSDLIKKHSRIQPGSRSFRTFWRKNND